MSADSSAASRAIFFPKELQIPFVKSFRAGQENPEITSILRANVRVPERAMGDMRAQLASIRTGERRVMHLLTRYGNQAFKDSIRQIYDQSEKLARAAVEKIPDGVYEAESFMDDDGVNLGKHIPIKVRVVVKGDQMTIDLSDVSPQVAGYYNSGITAGRSAAEVVFKCITAPMFLPINDGSFRPLKIILAARTGRERGEAGAGAGLDDRADDRVRHDFPRAGARLSRAHHRRPLRRSVHGQPAWFRCRDRTFFLVAHRPSGRRLGRQVTMKTA